MRRRGLAGGTIDQRRRPYGRLQAAGDEPSIMSVDDLNRWLDGRQPPTVRGGNGRSGNRSASPAYEFLAVSNEPHRGDPPRAEQVNHTMSGERPPYPREAPSFGGRITSPDARQSRSYKVDHVTAFE
jgi:hypothetical protein